MRTLALLLSVILFTNVINCQSNQEIAHGKKNQAIDLMDNGKPDEAIKILEEARKLDPSNFEYDYEIGYAYYLKEDFKQSLKYFQKVVKYNDINAQCYQMLGNLLDINGKPEEALKAYDKGLALFPNSGNLYLEKGNVYWALEKYGEALPFYEKGIEADPAFPSNYYRATYIYLNSDEEVWGMIYGEIYMNLVRNSSRTAEISKMLYETYKSEIDFTSDSSFSVSFSKNSSISLNDLSDLKKLKLPYGVGVYEPTLSIAVIGDTAINLNSLDRIRTRFIENYYSTNSDEKYPNILFEFHKNMIDSGYFEAYNHWLLMKGDEEAFVEWKYNNSEKWEAFLSWYAINGLEVSDEKKFFTGQY